MQTRGGTKELGMFLNNEDALTPHLKFHLAVKSFEHSWFSNTNSLSPICWEIQVMTL